MEIIISHTNMDLDGLASMMLAKKLHPLAELVFAGNINENVKELTALYQNYLHIHHSREINLKKEKITKLIIVDTHSIDKIGKFKELLNNENIEIIVYDHHYNQNNPIKSEKKYISNYGSNTTHLLKLIESKNIKFKMEKYEATIYMMGIYEDTGSLSYTNTTPEDIKMAAYLLENGANLEEIASYTKKSLKDVQVEIFLDLIKYGEIVNFSVDSIFFAKYYTDTFLDGFDNIINKIKIVEGVDGAFVLCGNDKKSYIIGRSSSINISVDEILAEFNGGGHFNAGSASIMNTNFNETFEKLKKIAIDKIKTNKLAKDIMQSPVKTVNKEIKLKELYKILLRFGYSGLPVTENNKLIGMISRKDVDKTIIHGFGNAPVKAYMTSKLITADTETPLEILKKIIIENEIGRIPILDEDENLVGIVTRSDILRNLYERRRRVDKGVKVFEENIKNLINKRISTEIMNILKKISEVSKSRKEKVYLVGGIVRDLILGIDNYDIDIVVEGNGIEFTKELGIKFNAKKVITHEKFKTGVVVINDDLKIDVATSRVEYYEYPSSLPIVESGTIKQDMFRRDFTVNAMALEIDYINFGKLIDYFNGYNDLMQKKLKVLHNLSFIEDPTRIIRGIRFANRYNFKIDNDTKKFMKDAVENRFLEKLTWKRLKYEFQLIFSEPNAKRAIEILFEYDVLRAINPAIKFTDKLKLDIENIENNLLLLNNLKIEKWIVYFLILLEELNTGELEKTFNKFVFSLKFIEKYNYGRLIRKVIIIELKEVKNKSQIYHLLKKLSNEMLFVLYVTSEDKLAKEHILYFINNLKDLKTVITGKFLINKGYKAGPELKIVIDEIFNIQIDMNIIDEEELYENYLKNKM